jgi:cyanate permease
MVTFNPFSNFAYGELLQTLLPDFVLAFAFFTALCYAVLAKRFGQQRPAVAMSAAIGLALAIGLVWWEQAHGWSIRNFGPIAVGVALIFLAMLLYQAVKQVGGPGPAAALSWAPVS